MVPTIAKSGCRFARAPHQVTHLDPDLDPDLAPKDGEPAYTSLAAPKARAPTVSVEVLIPTSSQVTRVRV